MNISIEVTHVHAPSGAMTCSSKNPPILLELLVHARLLEDRPATIGSNNFKKVVSIYIY
jgi:hypothetical protein